MHGLLTHPLLALALASVGGLAGPAPAAAPVERLAVPPQGAYTGAYLEFGDFEDQVTLEAIEGFSDQVGKPQALVAFSNFWGRGAFPTQQVQLVAAAGAVPLIYWNPWDNQDERERTRFDLAAIAAGQWDAYIDAWGRAAAAWGRPLLVAFGLEMNGTWFPWSGVWHGGGALVPGSDPPRHQGPEAFKDAYRHVVERVRAAGACNVSWVFHTNNISAPQAPWNNMAAYYPGSDYVDWVGMSAYGKQFPDQGWIPVAATLLQPWAELSAVDPGKPLILAEWGVGEFPDSGDKGTWIQDAFAAMERLPGLKAAVYWHERWQNANHLYSNLRVTSSAAALTAYRAGVSRPFWLAAPQTVPARCGAGAR